MDRWFAKKTYKEKKSLSTFCGLHRDTEQGQFHEILWYTFLLINQLHLGPWLSGVKLYPYGFHIRCDIDPLFFPRIVSHNADKNKFLYYLC